MSHSLEKNSGQRKATLLRLTTGAERHRQADSGYAYLMSLFLVLSLVVSSQVLLRNLVTERISQREQELIWRGDQWTRAVRMYYRKTGHYPQKQDDLLTGVPDIHFLRSEAMRDPMNKDGDGAWRFIYTNAAGAIIGSVKYGSMQQMALMDMNGGQMPSTQLAGPAGTPTATASLAADAANTQATTAATAQVPQQNSPTGTSFGLGLGTPTPPQGAPGTPALGAGQILGPLGQPATAMGAMMQPTGPVDGPVVGGMLIGVGSKVDKHSVRVYKGGKKYNEWEFIWNPLEEQAQAVQQGLGQQGTGAAGLGLGGLPLGPTGATVPTPGQNGNGLIPSGIGGFGGAIITNPNGGDNGANSPPAGATANPASGAPGAAGDSGNPNPAPANP